MNAPFASPGGAIPVTVMTTGDFVLPEGAVLVTVNGETGHEHSGAECLVCSTRGNIRVLLFELLAQTRTGSVPKFSSVVVDARQAADPQAVTDALIPGKLPAFGLRDHTVARIFRLV